MVVYLGSPISHETKINKTYTNKLKDGETLIYERWFLRKFKRKTFLISRFGQKIVIKELKG